MIAKLRDDHDYMVSLMKRIRSQCDRIGAVAHCSGCEAVRRSVCRNTMEQLIRVFVEVTLRHNLLESAYMGEDIPLAHRAAHLRAHGEIAERLQSIRLVFAETGNGVVAIEGIDEVLTLLTSHLAEYDQPLERYLAAAA